MGSLYLAKDPKIGRLVAIKLVRADFDSPEARQRFQREAQSAGTLRHPNIVTIFDVDEHAGSPYIAMEYIDGETLSEIVRRRAPLPLAQRLKWVEDLCSALAYAHRQGIIHRDIKPANLMVDNEGTLKILDFGLARTEQSKFTQSQTLIGTPNYMAPEQIRSGEVGPRSDIFAVGAVLYEIIAYKEAFPGSVHQAMHKVLNESPVPLEQLQPTIDRGVVTIVARALEKDPQRRYQELSTMRAELAIVRQRLENQVDQEAQTLVAPPPAGTHSSPPSSHSSHPSRAATGTGRIGGHHRASLQKKRDAQISSLLGKARQAFDEGALEKAKEAVEQALMFDTEHPLATQLLEEITVEEERKIVAEFVAKARTELQAGRFDEAERIVNEGLSIVPHSTDIQQLREAVETARKEIERARQIQDMLRRARARFSEGSFEGAIRAVGELLAIDPGNTAAIELQGRAQAAIDARGKRVHHDAAAQALIGEARKLFDSGDKAAAISKLEAFSPPHDLVTGFLASLRGEQIAEALPDVLPETLVAQNPPTMAFMPGRSKESPAVHVGSGSRAPIYVGVAVAVALLVAVGVWLMTRPTEPAVNPAATAAPTSADTSPAPAPAPTPAPAVPPPPVVAPPTSLASVNEKDREDVFAAYKLIGIGDLAGAARIVAQIAKRDPKNADLRELRSAIQKVQQAEKERLDELAAANARAATAATAPASAPPESAAPSNPNPAPAPAPAPSNPDPVAPTPPKPASSEPAFTVLPGGGFAANSEPPSPAMLGELERPAIEAVVQQYESALNGRNMKAASQARTFTPAEARNWENTFKNYALFQLSAKVLETPLVTGDRGTVKVEERLQYTQRRGGIQITQNPNVIVYRLEKIGGKWHILPPGGS